MQDKPIIDVDELVADLKRRVARERAEGRYADVEELAAIELETPAWDSGGDGPRGGGAYGTRIRFRPELAFSSKPVVGPVISGVKRVNVRLLQFVLDDLARQADAAVFRLESALDAEVAAREEGDAYAREAIDAEVAVRELVQQDVRNLAERIAALEETLKALQLEPRLARLERASRAAAAPAPASAAAPSASADAPAAASTTFDYLRFEDRFRPEDSVVERVDRYLAELRGRRRVVDLGCGRGELLERLREEGVSAYGVELDPDFVGLLAERGIEVAREDALAHLQSLADGDVDGIVAIHLVEHLPGRDVARLVELAEERLSAGGVLILETPNPESLVAGSINFHRDPTHVRPVHPETLAFLAESAGFVEVEIRRLSPVSGGELLPRPPGGELAPLLDRLDALLYGFQDYAVVARKP